ncbi:hypothetical protein BD309DRAFT_951363 [Dichomitus squalens]|uniref:Uncharacterized protein n=1 Tax=Dichomitus squalens TaxID=114155 RepID=A0A4Q9N220_9APHY|nr:uncharacterized protein DICSQDRAFT_152589 [Dichomitus squalens LYAD-421 SS1]EJF65370.1 hypothetical protein DICSQDRAFT_152589 [Dichomitus squalens LYAD-421 SS1]TBU33878.1 hypothetical protein BD311DRAFT_684357 [Dichomitus squalens]TBU47630.1 hypothetical protein BD309DRAFT_951363 [Dichomitus squalens]TBU56862.1 hypothetical protein BD310DRAFT_930669 [Dichomitus squalens]
MIRRPPTMIPMTEMDVQQVSDAITRQRAAKLAKKQGTTQAKTSSTPIQPYHHAEEAKKKREAMTKDERLGLR